MAHRIETIAVGQVEADADQSVVVHQNPRSPHRRVALAACKKSVVSDEHTVAAIQVEAGALLPAPRSLV